LSPEPSSGRVPGHRLDELVALERLVDCPEEHMKFHIWYLKSNGWIERLDNGQYAITASGVDRATREAGGGPLRLPSGGHDAPAPEV
jgi:hypothetical protein